MKIVVKNPYYRNSDLNIRSLYKVVSENESTMSIVRLFRRDVKGDDTVKTIVKSHLIEAVPLMKLKYKDGNIRIFTHNKYYYAYPTYGVDDCILDNFFRLIDNEGVVMSFKKDFMLEHFEVVEQYPISNSIRGISYAYAGIQLDGITVGKKYRVSTTYTTGKAVQIYNDTGKPRHYDSRAFIPFKFIK